MGTKALQWGGWHWFCTVACHICKPWRGAEANEKTEPRSMLQQQPEQCRQRLKVLPNSCVSLARRVTSWFTPRLHRNPTSPTSNFPASRNWTCEVVFRVQHGRGGAGESHCQGLGCALLWTAFEFELLSFSSFAFDLALRTAECLSHLLLVYVCVVTNRTKNHDRIAYMWKKKKAVVGASQCKVSPRSSQCLVQHGLEFGHLLNVWLSGPFLCQTSDPKLYVVFHFGASFFFVLLHVSLRQLDMWRMKCGVWSLSVQCEVRSVKFGVGSKQWEVWSVKWEVWSVDCAVWSEKCEVWSLECEVWSGKEAVRSVKCGLWSVECEVRSKECEVRSVKEAVRSEKCEVWTVKCEVWSEKCEVRSVKEAVKGEKC